jgi:phage terminase Nu1 subunit (DNA packaging protein)
MTTTQADFARLRGVSRKQVTEWKRDGYLVFDSAGGVDVQASNMALDDRPKNHGFAVASTQDLPSLSQSRRKKEAALASMRELELARRRGELVPVADIQPVWSRIVLGIRNAFLSLPSRAAQELGLTREQAKVLDRMIREALTVAASDDPPARGA